MFCRWENNFNLKPVSLNADEQVQNASVHWRGGRSEDTHGEQLQASAAPQRQKRALFQLMRPLENQPYQDKTLVENNSCLKLKWMH